MTLAHTFVGPSEASRTILLVHGLLASGRNLRSLGRALTQALPDTRVLLVDLPGHGDSPKLAQSHDVTTVRGCAQAVAGVVRRAGSAVDAVIGHSFGGKVALLLARSLADVRCVWTLDTQLDADPEWRSRSDVANVIAALRAAQLPTPERKDVATQLSQAGLSQRVAEWMTTNLEKTDLGYAWVFDLDQIELLTDDYFHLDAFSLLANAPSLPAVHLLRAENGDRWSPESIARAQALPSPPVNLHVLPDAGHWVHADNLPGLLQLLLPTLQAH